MELSYSELNSEGIYIDKKKAWSLENYMQNSYYPDLIINCLNILRNLNGDKALSLTVFN